MSEAKLHKGSCHCGAVQFEATVDTSKGTSCNCSICGRMGWILAFIPAEQFKLVSGTESLKDYQFGKKHIHHLFCSSCGVRSFGRGAGPDGKEMIALNLRCIDDFELSSVAVNHFDGKSI